MATTAVTKSENSVLDDYQARRRWESAIGRWLPPKPRTLDEGDPAELASLLRSDEPIPQFVRDYFAGMIDHSRGFNVWLTARDNLQSGLDSFVEQREKVFLIGQYVRQRTDDRIKPEKYENAISDASELFNLSCSSIKNYVREYDKIVD